MFNHSTVYKRGYCGVHSNNNDNIIVENEQYVNCITCIRSYSGPLAGVREPKLPMVNTFRMIHFYRPKGRYHWHKHNKFNKDLLKYINGVLANYYKVIFESSQYTYDEIVHNIYRYIIKYYSDRPSTFPSKKDIFYIITDRMLVADE